MDTKTIKAFESTSQHQIKSIKIWQNHEGASKMTSNAISGSLAKVYYLERSLSRNKVRDAIVILHLPRWVASIFLCIYFIY